MNVLTSNWSLSSPSVEDVKMIRQESYLLFFIIILSVMLGWVIIPFWINFFENVFYNYLNINPKDLSSSFFIPLLLTIGLVIFIYLLAKFVIKEEPNNIKTAK